MCPSSLSKDTSLTALEPNNKKLPIKILSLLPPPTYILGNKKFEQQIKIYTTDISSNPQLAYVDVTLTSVDNKNNVNKGPA